MSMALTLSSSVKLWMAKVITTGSVARTTGNLIQRTSGYRHQDHRRPLRNQPPLFKWRPFAGEIIVCGVLWYLRYALSYRDVEELLQERGVSVDHTTVLCWVQRYTPELDKRCRPHLTETNDSYRVAETYIKIKKQWYYLYRAVDSAGQTIDFLRSARRDVQAAERFFRKALRATHTTTPRVITVDKNAAYPSAFETLHQEG
jgi:IS6 family transposase